jgi:hypothetical protein
MCVLVRFGDECNTGFIEWVRQCSFPFYFMESLRSVGISSSLKVSLSQPAKTLVPSYYCLYSLYNKIRNKGKIVSAGYW